MQVVFLIPAKSLKNNNLEREYAVYNIHNFILIKNI